MRIVVAAGTRPEAIKLAPVHKAFLARDWRSIWVASGQHGVVKDRALAALGVEADVKLDAPADGATLGARLAHMIAAFDSTLGLLKPDLLVVQGDTSTTIAATLAAFSRQVPVGHVEAGLRTFDNGAPFPEEGWRATVGKLATLHFAPTARAAANLRREAVPSEAIHVTGNTVIDALKSLPLAPPPIALKPGRRLVTITLHRRENWNGATDRVIEAVLSLRDRQPDVDFLFVAHANPALASRVRARLDGEPHITVCDPLDYPEFVALMRASTLMLSDSGGVQEEAPAFGVPVLVLRDSTERMEAIDAGVACLVGTDVSRIVSTAMELLNDADAHAAMARAASPFGDGSASQQIVKAICAWAPALTSVKVGLSGDPAAARSA